MGVLADAVLENGGQVIGVIPTFLKDRELAHPGLTFIEPGLLVITQIIPIDQGHIVVFFRHALQHPIDFILPTLCRYPHIDPVDFAITDLIHKAVKLGFCEGT